MLDSPRAACLTLAPRSDGVEDLSCAIPHFRIGIVQQALELARKRLGILSQVRDRRDRLHAIPLLWVRQTRLVDRSHFGEVACDIPKDARRTNAQNWFDIPHVPAQ